MQEVKTPSYVFAINELRERIRFLRDCLGENYRLVYAMKANPFLVQSLMPLTDGFEVCSPGEERICRRLGVPARKMVLSGVNKEEEQIEELVRHYREKAVYTIESKLQAERLNSFALRESVKIPVLLRLSSGNQFGMDAKTVEELFTSRADYPGLVFKGLHFFSGTQKKLKKITEEIGMLDELLISLRNKLYLDNESAPGESSSQEILSELEYGPGLPISYFQSDREISEPELLLQLRNKLEAMKFRGQITLEMGRFIAAPCGYYLTKVMDLKENEDASYCITDGGIHQMNYFGQMMGMKVPGMSILKYARKHDLAAAKSSSLFPQEQPASDQPQQLLSPASDQPQQLLSPASDQPQLLRRLASEQSLQLEPLPSPDHDAAQHWTICGSLCTTADVMIRDLSVQDLQLGDVLVFEKAGAYSVTEGISLFLSRDLPRIYLYDGSSIFMARDKILTEEWNYGRIDGDT